MARWILDAYKTPEKRLEMIESNGHHDVEKLKQAVKAEFEKRKLQK